MNKGSYDYIEASGRWRWRGYFRDPITGKLRQKALYASEKKKLREKVERWQLNLDTGEAGKDMSLSTWAKIWINDVIADNVKPRTREAYEYAMNHLLQEFGEQAIGKIGGYQLQDFFNSLHEKFSAATVSLIRRYTIMIFDVAVAYGFIFRNPARLTRVPRQERREIIALSKEQTEAIIAVAEAGEYQQHPHHDEGAEYLRRCYYVLILLAVDTGMRQGEIMGLHWADIHDDYILVNHNLVYSRAGRIIDSPKTRSSARKVILTNRCIAVLKKWRTIQGSYANRFSGLFHNDRRMVFTTAVGSFVDAHNFMRRCWRPICSSLGLKGVTFHDLRHAHASQLLAAGVNPQIVMQRLGHSSLDITLRIYAHLLPSMQEAAMGQINKIFKRSD